MSENGLGQPDSGNDPASTFSAAGRYTLGGGLPDMPDSFGTHLLPHLSDTSEAPTFGVKYRDPGVREHDTTEPVHAAQYRERSNAEATTGGSTPAPATQIADSTRAAFVQAAANLAPKLPSLIDPAQVAGGSVSTTGSSTPGDKALDTLIGLVTAKTPAAPTPAVAGGGVYQKAGASTGSPVVLIVCVVVALGLVAYYYKSQHKKGKKHGGDEHEHGAQHVKADK